MNELEPTLKTGRRNAINGAAKLRGKPATEGKSSTGTVDRVTLSESSKSQASTVKTKTSEIRHELVNKFRDVLQNGSYQVKADEIADKIVQKIRENKNRLVL